MSFFTPCSGCRRHVQADAASCPFCGAAAPGASAQAPRVVAQRLPRRALVAIGASAIVLGCSSGDGTSSGTDTGTGADSTADTGLDTGSPAPAYGLPADTGTADTSTDTGSAVDSGKTDGAADADGATDSGGPAPAYGLPPADAG
ncbi:MAG: hypothetical protein IPJ34_31385 [Myxococcales bacterium]|nr:hypothetical protein [Myxococcales bacterium]